MHGIDQPNLWHGNSLTHRATYSALFDNAPKAFDVILANPPFGGKEGKDAQKSFAYATSSTQVLFLQNILAELAPQGTCAIVLDEGLLFRTNESAFVETKRKLVDECDLWAIISLPGGVFSTAGAGVKTNLLFFTKGRTTAQIWYYDLSYVKVGKKTPLTLAHFGFAPDGTLLATAALPAMLTADWMAEEANAGKTFPSYARMMQHRGTPEGESRYSWSVDFAERRAKARAEMQPLRDEVDATKAELINLKELFRRLKRSKDDRANVEVLDEQIRELQVKAKNLEGKITDIDAAVFDLKADNPHIAAEKDMRSPIEIINDIKAQDEIIARALSSLENLMSVT